MVVHSAHCKDLDLHSTMVLTQMARIVWLKAKSISLALKWNFIAVVHVLT